MPRLLLVVLVAVSALAFWAVPAGAVTFSQATGSPFAVGSEPTGEAVGDLNGDGKPDLVIANRNDGTVSVLLGNGDGTFSPATGSPISVDSGSTSVVIGDFNGDGKPDLAVANQFTSPGTVSVLLGNGDGTFSAATGSPISVGAGPDAIAMSDFNRDGNLDLVIANRDDNTVSVLLGNGDGTFTQATGSPIGGAYGPNAVAVGDFNSDGRPDFAFTTTTIPARCRCCSATATVASPPRRARRSPSAPTRRRSRSAISAATASLT
jgi:hypothetical protein